MVKLTTKDGASFYASSEINLGENMWDLDQLTERQADRLRQQLMGQVLFAAFGESVRLLHEPAPALEAWLLEEDGKNGQGT